MVSASEDIYEIKQNPTGRPTPLQEAIASDPLPHEEAARPAQAVSVEQQPVAIAVPGVQPPARRIEYRVIATYLLVTGFVLGFAYWAGVRGIELRDQLWRTTRTVRFDGDIRNGYRYGEQALREGETVAGLQPFADATGPVHATPQDPDNRRLTPLELIQGIVHFCQRTVDDRPAGNYGLDYPPLRLLAMTLWARHTQRLNPDIEDFPLRENARDVLLPQQEDFARPILNFNTVCDGVAAIAMFFLVWLWMQRDAARRAREVIDVSSAKARAKLPRGMIAFVVATVGFWYALVQIATPPLRPSPVIDLVQVEPAGGIATVRATINPQQSNTSWHIDWGTTETYGRKTSTQWMMPLLRDEPVQAEIQGIKPGETYHYRIWASNAGGVISTPDRTFTAADTLLPAISDRVGGVSWPDWTVWLRLLGIFIAMVAAARMLPGEHRGWACGLVAALMVWFDPINLLNSHAWPQWDVWILPFFLLAALLASLDAWVMAGVFLGIGCLFKGQLLLAAPVLVLWPLFSGRLGAATRLVGGLAAAAGVVLWPWLISSNTSVQWVEMVMLAAAIVAAATLLRPKLWWQRPSPVAPTVATDLGTVPIGGTAVVGYAPKTLREKSSSPGWVAAAAAAGVLASVIAGILIFRHWPQNAALPTSFAVALMLMIIIPPWLLRRRSLAAWATCVFAAAVWIGAFIFDGSFSWLIVGYKYGSIKQDRMAMGLRSFANLPALLMQRFGWNLHDIAASVHTRIAIPGPIYIAHRYLVPAISFDRYDDLEMKTLLLLIYGACLLMCGIAAAVHARRKDPRLLLALVAPWVIFPLVLGQMSERYLLWGSAISCACIAVSTGLTLLHVLLALLGAGMLAHQLLEPDPGRWPQLNDLFGKMYPDGAWMMLLIALIFLWSAVTPSRRATRDAELAA